MTQILRHGAENKGIEIRPDGFILLSDLLSQKNISRMKIGLKEVHHIVKSCSKQRFELKEEDGMMLIRAT